MRRECERYCLLIHGYLDGELTPEEKKEVEEHLPSCERCATAFERMRGLTGDLNRMSFHFTEADVWEEVKERLLSAREKRRSAYVSPTALVATMVIYKVIDGAVDFEVAILLKPIVLLVVALLLALHKQNPFRLLESLNGTSSGAPR